LPEGSVVLNTSAGEPLIGGSCGEWKRRAESIVMGPTWWAWNVWGTLRGREAGEWVIGLTKFQSWVLVASWAN
jgi:hypothetical protein